jgi:hypothetical protein
VENFASDSGLILTGDAVLGLENAIRFDGNLAAEVFKLCGHYAPPIVMVALLSGCAAFPLVAVGIAVVDDACEQCLPRPR